MCSMNDTADPLLQCNYKKSGGDVMCLWAGALELLSFKPDHYIL